MSKAELKATLDQAEWAWLKPHVERDAVIVVAHPLDILDAAEAVVGNDTERVEQWITSGLLNKPNPEQIQTWNENPDQKFMCIVAQPYVLVQLLHS